MSQQNGKEIGGSWHRCGETSDSIATCWTCQKHGRRDGPFKTSEWFAMGSTGSNRRNYSHLVQVGLGQCQSHLHSTVGSEGTFDRRQVRPMWSYDSDVPMVPWFLPDSRFRERSRREKNKGSADVLGTRTFSVRTDTGVWKRHEDQLRSTAEQTGSTTEPVGLPTTAPAALPALQFDRSAPIGSARETISVLVEMLARLTTTAAVLSTLYQSQRLHRALD